MDKPKPQRDKVIDFPLQQKAELDTLQAENRKAVKEYLNLSESFFTILFRIKQNLDLREQQRIKRQKITDHAFRRLHLDKIQPWQCDYEAAQFYTIKQPEEKPENAG